MTGEDFADHRRSDRQHAPDVLSYAQEILGDLLR